MKFNKVCVLLLSLGFVSEVAAQHIPDIESLLESNGIENTQEGYEEMISTLLNFYTSPLNVNTASFDSLKLLFFLSDSQIDQLIAYRKKNGNFLHTHELLWVPGIGKQDLNNLLPFISVGKSGTREKLAILKTRTRHELLAKVRTSLPEQEGYKLYSPDDFEKKKDYERKIASRFHGPPVGTLMKYKISYSNHLQAGFTLENDPGESYFSRNQRSGFDFLSAHACLTTERWYHRIVLGDYRIQWGQGLVAWGGFASGKSNVAVGNEKSGKGFAAYTSTDENRFMRGIAISMNLLPQLSADVFFSQKKTDGNVTAADTLSDEDWLAVSLYESGYHRNNNECGKKHTLKEKATGLSVRWNTAYFRIGMNALYYDFSPELIPGGRVYQKYNDTGKDRYLLSLDYKTSWRSIYLFGETAFSDNGAVATVNGIRSGNSWMSACLLYRRYDKRYVSHYASGFGEYSNTSNEEGVYCGVDLSLVKNLKVNLYYDWFRHFAPRYLATFPGSGWECLAEVDYRHGKFGHQWRYKRECRPEDLKGKGSVWREKSEYRYQLSFQWNKVLEFRTRFNMSQYHKDKVRELGYLVFEDVIVAPRKTGLKMQYRLGWFKTDSYQSRIYAYENNVLYGYSFPAFMGEGWRTYLNLSWKPVNRLTCYLKAGFVIYPRQEVISSGVTQVDSNRLYDLTFQIRLSI